ncbi:MAG: hypothetical protein ACOVT5_12390, partial [Armatimonadaceae bacterium]
MSGRRVKRFPPEIVAREAFFPANTAPRWVFGEPPPDPANGGDMCDRGGWVRLAVWVSLLAGWGGECGSRRGGDERVPP